MHTIIQNVVDSFSHNTLSSSYIEGNEFTKKYELSSSTIQTLSRVSVKPGIVFIDGGQGLIYETPTDQIYLLQIASVCAIQHKPFTIQHHRYVVHIGANITIYDKDNNKRSIPIDNTQGAISAIRRLLELEHAMHISDELIELREHYTIVLDGSLHDAEDCIAHCKKNNHLLVGLSKTSTLRAENNQSPIQYFKKKETSYLSIGATNHYHTFMVQLHEHASFIFRCDISTLINVDYNRVMGQLTTLSNDGAFLGYPYPLIKADMLARVSNEHLVYLQQSIRNNNKNRGFDAHYILDHLRF